MNYTIDNKTESTRQKIKAFVTQHVVPVEQDPTAYDAHENLNQQTIEKLRAKAKEEGLWAFQMPQELGGRGFSIQQMAVCYEQAAWSPFGPVVFNCAAPDDGNMIVLNKILDQEQKAKWLQPIVDGTQRSAFAMTEPDGGCGSDPSLTYTTATKAGEDWIINGRKWFITGAEDAGVFIVIAKTSDDPRKGLTAFLLDAKSTRGHGWDIVRRIPIMGPEEHGGHCELIFDGLRIPDSQRLLQVGDGLKVTQIRLGTARLTHCMRWLGLARRCLDIAAPYIKTRQSFGSSLSEHEGVQWMLGEAARDIQIGRLLTMHAAWKLDQGDFAKNEISMAKIQVADTLFKAVDTAIQLCGAKGYSKDTILEWVYRYARQAKLVDGASEIHKMVLAKNYLARGDDFFGWDVQ